ncbi:MAG: efflux RND transporter periplasmic adaptor subunit [Phycisphaerales bacterium]
MSRIAPALLIPLALALALVVHAAPAVAQGGPPATPVRADAARLESTQRMFTVVGNVQPRRRAVVASEEEGLTLEVAVEEGDTVSAGALLAQIDSDLIELQIEAARASLAEAHAAVDEAIVEVEQAERDLNSLVDLSQSNAARPKEVEDARSALKLEETKLERARKSVAVQEAEIKRWERRLAGHTIRAPFNGVVVDKRIEIGEWIPAGGAVVDLIETGRVDAVLDVPEGIVNALAVGDEIEVRLRALDDPVTGRVRAIVPVANEQARSYPVRVALDDQGGAIKPGMSLTAFAPTGEMVQSITVSKDAVMRSPTGAYVFVVRDGMAMQMSIETGSSAGVDRVIVNGPIGPGDLIVVEGNERLYPGAPVRPMETGAEAPIANGG